LQKSKNQDFIGSFNLFLISLRSISWALWWD